MRLTSAYLNQPALAPGAWNQMGGNYTMASRAGRWFPAANTAYPIDLRYAQRQVAHARQHGAMTDNTNLGAVDDPKVVDQNDYTALYVVGGVVVAGGLVYLLTRKKRRR